jgi:4-oxalocrotonate tautomerase family enzyme
MSIFMQTNRRAALGALDGSAALFALNTGATASAEVSGPPAGGALIALSRKLAAIPRRRGFTTVPFLVTSPQDWDQAAAAQVLAYRYKSLQMWENSELGGPWLNLMREAVNGQVFAHGNPDFLAVSATHGSAHLALFGQEMWDRYKLAGLAGGKFMANSFIIEKPSVSPDDDHQDLGGYYGPNNNNILTLQRRGVVFIACHDSIHAIARNVHATPDFAATSPDIIAADLTNSLVSGAILVPSVVAFMVELQRAGFTYPKGSGSMPVINVKMLNGRTAAQKSALIAELAEATKRTLGVPEEAIRILLTEIAPENWGVGSRSMAELRAPPSVGPKSD